MYVQQYISQWQLITVIGRGPLSRCVPNYVLRALCMAKCIWQQREREREKERERERERERELQHFVLHNSYLISLHMHIGIFWSASCNKWNQSLLARNIDIDSSVFWLNGARFFRLFFCNVFFHNFSLSLSLSLSLACSLSFFSLFSSLRASLYMVFD